MSFFQNIFNRKTSNNEQNTDKDAFVWRTLETVGQIDSVKKLSQEKVVVIFKHSTTCGISNMVWHQFQTEIDFDNSKIEMLYLDLLSNRDVSNEVSRVFQVLHQSPQILVIKNGEVLHHASHAAIRISDIRSFI
ncbi:bacillithiol system redox-active protein YtxJ [Psychroflexus aestuariivivens]|uniref:bacillithiol system redox-active protein YtxJ n=1 Tax=Psychroflexus aestuariivivens TaxID=1795040 RepID=UPI000FD741E1|nr:bacillithiol system redox-active protein YtxJ [Psychroflexus aestuariivivens]